MAGTQRLSSEQRRKVAQIKAALGKSDRAVYDHLFSISTFELSARKAKSGRVSREWVVRLGSTRRELLLARGRLDELDTGLRAQRLLRSSLTHSAAAFESWRVGLGSADAAEIDRAITEMQKRFKAAETAGKRGTYYLKRGL